MDVAADVDALGAESAFGEEGVGARDGRGGHAVRGQLQLAAAGGGGAGTAAGREEGERHLLLGRLGAGRVQGGFGAGFGCGLGELAAGSLAAGAVGAVRGVQRRGRGAAGAPGGPVGHGGAAFR